MQPVQQAGNFIISEALQNLGRRLVVPDDLLIGRM
jgi:hypothetical protein